MIADCKTAEGERRKADAFATLDAHREVYTRRSRRALLRTLLELGEATADDVRDSVELPPGIDPKCFGSVPGPLARAGIIRAAGFTKTCRPMAHARPVTLWTLADRAAALRWLATHAELPDPSDEGEGRAVQGTLFNLSQETATPTGAAVGAAL